MVEKVVAPVFNIDRDINEATHQSLTALGNLLAEEPAIAHQVVTLYAESAESGDKWTALLAQGDQERRYPFRLTAILGELAHTRTLRYVEFDNQTEQAIESHEGIKHFIDISRRTEATELKESIARKIQLLRLSVFTGRLAIYKARQDITEPDLSNAVNH